MLDIRLIRDKGVEFNPDTPEANPLLSWLGLLLPVFLIIGLFVYFVMRAMGELLLSNLNYKSFIDFSADLLGPWAGYLTGWTYWFCWVVTGIADVVAIAAYTQFWFPDLPQWIPALTCVGLLLSLNLHLQNKPLQA